MEGALAGAPCGRGRNGTTPTGWSGAIGPYYEAKVGARFGLNSAPFLVDYGVVWACVPSRAPTS